MKEFNITYNRSKKAFLLMGPFIIFLTPFVFILDVAWRFLRHSKIFIEDAWYDLKVNVKDTHYDNKREFNEMIDFIVLYFKILFNRPNNVIFKESKNKE